MYSKGANLLHTIRQLAKDDEVWRQTLRGLNKEFYHSTVTTAEIEEYISKSNYFKIKKISTYLILVFSHEKYQNYN